MRQKKLHVLREIPAGGQGIWKLLLKCVEGTSALTGVKGSQNVRKMSFITNHMK